MNIDAHTNFVIGNPIAHSQSPSLHQKLYKQFGINAVMLAIENPNLKDLVASIKTLGIRLTAVTLPFKTDILKYVDVLSEEVTALGAANTLILKNDFIYAYNTDIYGIQKALSHISLKDKNILIIGAGGAARAAAYALQGSELFYLNRTKEKAQALCEQFGGKQIMHEHLNDLNIDLIINATPIGMLPNIHESPLPDYEFKPTQTVFDMVYTPIETLILQNAKSAGAHCISGLTMFEAQAKKQIELSYGVTS